MPKEFTNLENQDVLSEQNDIQLIKEIIFVASLIIALLFVVALITYSSDDSAWSVQSSNPEVQNAVGVVGAWASDISFSLFGVIAFLLPVLLVIFSWQFYKRHLFSIENIGVLGLKLTGLVLLMVSVTSLAHLFFNYAMDLPQNIGGILGSWVANNAIEYGSNIGATLSLWLLFFTGSSMFINMSWIKVADFLGAVVLFPFRAVGAQMSTLKDKSLHKLAKKQRKERHIDNIGKRQILDNRQSITVTPATTKIQASERKHKEAQTTLFGDAMSDQATINSRRDLPTLDLLNHAKPSANGYSEETLQAMSRQVELKLKDFNIEVEVIGVQPGPVVTRFEFVPAPGIKASRITSLATDLARSLSQVSVRVVEVIPGKSVIGLEVPNEIRESVGLSEIIGSSVYEQSKSPLTFALGKDIAGNPVVADLAKMPHVLTAGTTGSGKSVCVNACVLSMLYKATPEEVRMIMIDPKMLELSVYEGIPHLLTPVVTDMAEAANALRWSVAEMERRYKLMSLLGVRNLSSYNKKVEASIKKGTPFKDPLSEDTDQTLEKLPYIVVLIDEFADMIMVVGKKVEELIVRLAQKARAAGIHLVLATQRPSVDVITGLIKSNVPTRMAFQVSSKMDSRVVLDQMGAEQLLGKGDMLFLPPGQAFPDRVHGAFVDEEEIQRVVDFLKQRYQTNYVKEILEQQPEVGSTKEHKNADGEEDELYDEAVKIVLESGKVSISGVQRQLRIGYNRSARLVEAMEKAGLVSAPGHNGQREILATSPE